MELNSENIELIKERIIYIRTLLFNDLIDDELLTSIKNEIDELNETLNNEKN